MAQGARQMPFKDVGSQVHDIAATDGFDKIAHVVAAAFELLDDVAVEVECDAAGVAREDQHALFTMENVADLRAAEWIGLEAADFEDQFGVAVVENANLRVG